jgi:hypothetical protein
MHVMRIGVAVAVLAVVGLMSACVSLKTDPAAETVAMAVLQAVRIGDEAKLRANLTPEASASISSAQARTLRAYAPPGKASKQRLINFFHQYGAQETLTLHYELTYPGEGLLYEARLKRLKAGDTWRAEYFHLQRATDAQLEANRFSLNRPPGHLIGLAMAAISPLAMLAALIAVIRAPRFKRKWLWAIVALVGAGSFTLNWSTGQWSFQPINLSLIGAGVSAQGFLGFYPYFLKFALPVGAIAAFWRAAKARREAKAALDAVSGQF